ncbi:MAG: helix-turn-helix domain-containing protein [Olsenella sp.]|nr:helix-turn-helix domain-containing protein [Olsenella sp.]
MANNRTRQHVRPRARVLSVNDAAAWANTSPKIIRRALDLGQLPAHHYFDEGFPKILEDDLEEWVRSQPLYKPHALA